MGESESSRGYACRVCSGNVAHVRAGQSADRATCGMHRQQGTYIAMDGVMVLLSRARAKRER